MNLDTRISRLEDAALQSEPGLHESGGRIYDLKQLTDNELIDSEARMSAARASGEPVQFTPELQAAWERIAR